MKILNKIINWDKYLLVFKVRVGYFVKFLVSEIIPALSLPGFVEKSGNESGKSGIFTEIYFKSRIGIRTRTHDPKFRDLGLGLGWRN